MKDSRQNTQNIEKTESSVESCITVKFTIKWCSQCPMCKLSEVKYDHQTDTEYQDMFCKALGGKKIHGFMEWHEIYTMHTPLNGSVDRSADRIPEDCPFRNQEITLDRSILM